MLGKTTYMSTYLSMWSNRARSGGYSCRLIITYSSPIFELKSLRFFDFFFCFFHGTLLDVAFWGFAGVWIRTFRQGAVKGELITPLFQEMFGSFCSSVNYSSMREVWCKSRGRWCSSISGTTSKLLWKGMISWINGRVFFGMGWSMVFPTRGTIPTYLGIMLETTVKTCQCYIKMITSNVITSCGFLREL